MISLRRRLLIGTGVGTAIVLIVAGTALFGLMRASLLGEFDKALCEKVTTLAAMVEQDERGVSLEFAEAEMGEFRPKERPEYFQAWLADGTVVGRSPSLGGEDLPRGPTDSMEPLVCSIILPNEAPGREVTLTFMPRLDDESPPSIAPEPMTIAIARDTLDMESSLSRLGLLLIVVCVSATLASVGVLAWLIRVGLAPVDRVAARISRIDERRLSTRIDSTQTPRELTPIVVRLNELLQRLDDTFRREKTLTGNVAHELRTPLAGIRSTLEVALLCERDWVSSRQAMSECLSICTQTQRMIENLLTMARLEVGAEAIDREHVDVGSLLRRAWTPFEDLARKRNLNIRWVGNQDLHLDTDPNKLMIVFGNILENAARYTNEGGVIAIEHLQSNGRVRIRVSNTGCELSHDELAQVFEPFWRGDLARVATGTHSGLGLALSRMIVVRLGGRMEAEFAPDGTFVVTVAV